MKLRLIPGSAALAAALVAAVIVPGGLAAQGRGQGAPPGQPQGRGQGPAPPAQPQTGQQAALIDLTGYWVSVVDEDWRFRMMTPPKGDYAQVPLNAAARKIADQFDPAQYGGDKYQTSGIVDCRAYGAAGLMHMPTRLQISWVSPDVLKIETDWGGKTRLLHFTPGKPFGDTEQALRNGEVGASHGPASTQGYSVTAWEQAYRFNATFSQRNTPRRGRGLGQNRAGEAAARRRQAGVAPELLPGW